MPAIRPEEELDAAQAALDHARQVRKFHRRRTARGSRQREVDIIVALDQLRQAMSPLRSMIGKFPYGPQTDVAEANREEIREMSEALQAERRKLWKMKTRRSPNAGTDS
jgi:hypothetical protein